MGHHQGTGPSTRMGFREPTMHPRWLVKARSEPGQAYKSCKPAALASSVVRNNAGKFGTATNRRTPPQEKLTVRSDTGLHSGPSTNKQQAAMSSDEPPSYSSDNDSEDEGSPAGLYSTCPAIPRQCRELSREISWKTGEEAFNGCHNSYQRVEQTTTPDTLTHTTHTKLHSTHPLS